MKNNPLDFINSLIDYQPFSVAPPNPEVSAFSSEPPLDKQQLLKNYLEIKKQKSNPQPVMQQPMEPQPVETQAVEPQPPVDNRNRLAEVAAGMGAALAGRNPMDVLNSFENKRKLEFDREQNKLKLADEKAQQDWENKFREKQLSETIASRKEIAAMQKESQKAQNANLPLDSKKLVETLSSKNASKVSIANQIDSVMSNWDNLSDEDKVIQGRQLIKTLNSTEGADAVGAEEAKRLGGQLEFALGNFTNSNPTQFGRNLKGFKENALATSAAIKRGVNENKRLIDKELGRQYENVFDISSNQFPKQVRKGNQIATVNDENELEEALQEGWQ